MQAHGRLCLKVVRHLVDPARAQTALMRLAGNRVRRRVGNPERTSGPQQVAHATLQAPLGALHDLSQVCARQRRHAHHRAKAPHKLGHEAPAHKVLQVHARPQLVCGQEPRRRGGRARKRKPAAQQALPHDALDPHERTGKHVQHAPRVQGHLALALGLRRQLQRPAVQELQEVALAVKAPAALARLAHQLVRLVPKCEHRPSVAFLHHAGHAPQLAAHGIANPSGARDARAVDAHQLKPHDLRDHLHHEALAARRAAREHERARAGQVQVVHAAGAHLHALQARVRQPHHLAEHVLLPHHVAPALREHLVARPRQNGLDRLHRPGGASRRGASARRGKAARGRSPKSHVRHNASLPARRTRAVQERLCPCRAIPSASPGREEPALYRPSSRTLSLMADWTWAHKSLNSAPGSASVSRPRPGCKISQRDMRPAARPFPGA